MCEWRMVTQTCGGIELQKSTNMHVLPECIYTMLPRYNSGNILMLPCSSYKPACDTLGLPNDRVTIRCLVCILGSTRLLEAFYKNGPVFLQGQHGKQKDLCKSQGAFYRLFQFANLGSHVNLYRCFWKNYGGPRWSRVIIVDANIIIQHHTRKKPPHFQTYLTTKLRGQGANTLMVTHRVCNGTSVAIPVGWFSWTGPGRKSSSGHAAVWWDQRS